MQDKYPLIVKQLSSKFAVSEDQVNNVFALLEADCAVPFIARYRKTQTGGLATRNLRAIEKLVIDFRELEKRRQDILNCVKNQGKLTEQLQKAIESAKSKQVLEDLYLPYRPQRMTKGITAKQRGLEPLAKELLGAESANLEEFAAKYVNSEHGVANANMALEGARQILMEGFSENAGLLKILREHFWKHAVLHTADSNARKDKPKKYAGFWHYSQPIKDIAEQQLVTIFEGRAESYLKLSMSLADGIEYGTAQIREFFKLGVSVVNNSAWLRKVIEDSWTLKILPKLEVEAIGRLREQATTSLIKSSIGHFRQLLFLPPAGAKVTMSLLPNAKSGVAVAVVDKHGELIDTCLLYPVGMQGDWYQALASVAKLVVKHNVELISVVNNAGFREIERLIREFIAMYPDITVVTNKVDIYGLLEYAQSAVAKAEFPELDTNSLAAISAARRSQDHLAELAKLDIKSLTATEHEFCKARLQQAYMQAIQDCVCAVGVDLNNASWQLLSRLPGINDDLAQQIYEHRKQYGNFKSLTDLSNLSNFTTENYQQAVGFLYIFASDNLLDSLSLHPESYSLVGKFAKELAVSVPALLENPGLLDKLNVENSIDSSVNTSVKEIIASLKHPYADPRGSFKLPRLDNTIKSFRDLHKGLELEGVVSRITGYGAFVDIGVYQDGLIHVSALKDKHGSLVKLGRVVKVKVSEVNQAKKRFGLVLQTNDRQVNAKPNKVSRRPDKIKNKPKPRPVQNKTVFNTAMADALAKLRKGDDA